MSKEVILAKSAGMCYGVKRAIKLAESLESEGGGYTYGELIHNNDTIKRLEEKNIFSTETVNSDLIGKKIIIRSHGVGADVYEKLSEMNIEFIDATCPDVKKIHNIVREYSDLGYDVLVAGDCNHPEVIGTLGQIVNRNISSFAISSPDEIEKFKEKNKSFGQNALILIAQTTYDKQKWIEYKKKVKKHYTNVQFFDTICSATTNRQEETKELSKMCDIMFVIGGPHSSNSKKLVEISKENTKTFFIENVNSIEREQLKALLSKKKDIKIGITAGASTPADIIKEVHSIMSEEIKDTVIPDDDIDFMAEVDKTFKRIYIGNRVKAYVVAVNRTEAIVDVGTKHSGYITADELTSNPNLQPSDVVKVGDEIDCIVTSINDAEGVVYLSKKRVDAAIGVEKIQKASENGDVLVGVVTNVVKGGVIISYEGARVFVPASQTGVPRNGKLEELLKKETKFKVIEVNAERNRVVGSISALLREQNEAKRAAFWASIEEGKKFTGEVKSIESYGVFVDLGGVDGMVHLSELSWNRIKHPKDVVSVGDKLDVYVKSFDPEKKRVSLGAKDPNDNPWTKFLADFKVDDVIKAQVVSLTPFGAFAQIIPGVDGLIHISQIALERVTNVSTLLSVGQVVDAVITDIDEESKRVSLSMKALLKKDEPEAETEEETENGGVVYSDDDKENFDPDSVKTEE